MGKKTAVDLMGDADFAALMCSRLCHDLVSPVGALTNGLELLEEEQEAEMQAQVRDLLMQSAKQTSRKLQFYRLAFGSASAYGETIACDEALSAIRGLLADKSIEHSSNLAGASANKAMVRLLLNLTLLAHEALLRGGCMTITLDENAKGVAVVFAGPKLLLPEAVKSVLIDPEMDPALDPRLVPAVLARAAADNLGLAITCGDHPEGGLQLAARPR